MIDTGRKIQCTDDEIIKASRDSISAAEAARKLGIKYDTYKKHATRLGVFKTNQAGVGIIKKKKYIEDESINYNYFNTIDSKLKAYLLGYIAADGGINCYKLTFMIQRRDKEILEKICDVLNVNKSKIIDFDSYRPGEEKKFPSCRLTISSKQIVTDLSKYNIIYNKTNINVNLFSNIPEEYKWSWLAGYIDGNGCFSCTRHKIDIVSNSATADSIKKYVIKKYNISCSEQHRYKNNITTEIIFGTKSVFCDIIKDYIEASPFHLSRKIKKVNDYIDCCDAT